MSETEARASDDATPDDSYVSAAASHEDQAREDDASEDAPADGPAEDPSDEAPEDPSDEAPEDDPDDAEDGPEPSWWDRSHPTFAGLVGFFTGVAYVIIVPGVYAALLGLLVSDTTAQKLFPLVLLALVVPLALLVPRKTRRFAQFMFLGIVSTAVVIALTTALVIWLLVQIDG